MANHISIHCRRCAVTAMALAVLLCPLPQDMALAARGKVSVGFGGIDGSDCPGKERDVQLAGSQSEIIIDISDDFGNETYRGLPEGPPEGLVWEASLQSDQLPISSAELLARVQPRFFVSKEQAEFESISRQGYAMNRYMKQPRYHFIISLPPELAGQVLCLRAAFDDPQYGHLEGSSCYALVAPCSEKDRQEVLGSYVVMAVKSQNYQRAIELTDSLLATGWRSWRALNAARHATRALALYDQELEYLDMMYETYGYVTSTGNRDSAFQAQEYERIRQLIRDLKNSPQPR